LDLSATVAVVVYVTRIGSRALREKNLRERHSTMASHALKHEPLDTYNLRLIENLHPSGWVNPEPGAPLQHCRALARALRDS